MPPLELVLFDMDGVLADTEPLHLDALNEVLAGHGVRIDEAEAARFLGHTDRSMLEALAREGRLRADPAAVAARKEAAFLERFVRSPLPPSDGVAELLIGLAVRGVKAAVASSSSRRIVEAVVASLGIGRCFEGVFTGDDVERGKPAPDLFLAAADRVGAAPSCCLVIEDSPHGVEAARRAGMRCVAVRTRWVAPDDLAAAWRVVGSLAEIDADRLIEEFDEP